MSIIDNREIAFDAEGVVEAITSAIGAAQSIGLPGLPPVAVRLDPAEGLVRLVYGNGQAGRTLALPGESLGALLISFCVRSGIPMPRFADKSVRVEAHAVVLSFRTETRLAKARAAAREPVAVAPPPPASVRREIGWAT